MADERSDSLHYDAIQVWTPANREPGAVSYPSDTPNPDREFGIVSATMLDPHEFELTLSDRVNALQGEKLIFIFVHGYNVPYANGVYRHAQLMEDFDGARGGHSLFMAFVGEVAWLLI